jgi:hypothetical protein
LRVLLLNGSQQIQHSSGTSLSDSIVFAAAVFSLAIFFLLIRDIFSVDAVAIIFVCEMVLSVL